MPKNWFLELVTSNFVSNFFCIMVPAFYLKYAKKGFLKKMLLMSPKNFMYIQTIVKLIVVHSFGQQKLQNLGTSEK